ncbi:DUF6586 family protein [Microbulbifer sp. THAF38]|uniref:DUF6586 family protein n=1 Tax=Microbulbifer sp. THAF38 TaxID=2587856 RepID=UPI0012678B49|nr:DUF6586 family protein [Microbulbifer sp. THAF38]QFT54636.1 hypothetical protein FIU95_08740 [Microbulbifer sp. THAF38]
MSNPYTGLVTSALRKSQLLATSSFDSAIQRMALEEGALLQLWKAYRAFLAELSHQLQLGFEPESLQVIVDSLHSQGKASVEVRELQLLVSEPGSWLSEFLRAWHQLLRLPPLAEDKGQGGNLIPAHNVAGPVVVDLSFEVLLKWHAALSELVGRQRANLEEC